MSPPSAIDLSPSTKVKRRVLTYWVLAISLTLLYVSLRGSTWIGSATLHTVMEAMSTLLALMVGWMALVRFYSKKNTTFLFISAAFLGTSFLDGYHAVVTSAAFKGYFPSDLGSLIPWSWIASRLFLAAFLFMSWWAWDREQRDGATARISARTVYSGAALFTVISFLFFVLVPLPPAYYPDLIFHRPEEFVPAIFFMLALKGYLAQGAWRTRDFEHWLVIALIVNLVSQVVFMSFSGTLFDLEFDVAHLIKMVSYICVLVGLFIDMYLSFRQVELGRVALVESNEKLSLEILERERTEEQLNVRRMELKRSNAELEKFAYICSHDLQEPLRKVQAFGDLLQRKYADALGDQGSDYLGRMQSAAARMSSLINDLLVFSRVGMSGDAFRLLDLSKVATEVLSDLEVAIDESGAKVTVAELPEIEADPLQMRQILQNMIGNALKYQVAGAVPCVEISGEKYTDPITDDLMCRIHIKDNGLGIDDQHKEQIFEIFQRLHGRHEYDGSGVGLAICRRIAERHGGNVSVSSTLGEGSIFTLTLKAVHAPAES